MKFFEYLCDLITIGLLAYSIIKVNTRINSLKKEIAALKGQVSEQLETKVNLLIDGEQVASRQV